MPFAERADEPHANNQDAMNVPNANEKPVTVLRSIGLVSWLRRIGHWLNEEESWSVLYPDGQLSRRMKRRDARAYKAIFGGSLVFRPRKPANSY